MITDLDLPFAELLRTLRESLQLSQRTVAQMVGVSQSLYSRWESGKAEPSDEQAERVLSVLDLKSRNRGGAL